MKKSHPKQSHSPEVPAQKADDGTSAPAISDLDAFSQEDLINGQALVPGLGRRMLAYMIDFAVSTVTGVALLMLVLWATTGTVLANALGNLYGVALFCLAANAAHHIFLESHPSWRATVGKRIMGLSVMNGQGNGIDRSTAMSRFIWRIPSVLSVGLLYLMAVRGNYGMALHDIKTATFTAVRDLPDQRVQSGLRAGREMTKLDKTCIVLAGILLCNLAYNLIRAYFVAPNWP